MELAKIIRLLKKDKMTVKAECDKCGMYQTYFDVPSIAKGKMKEFNRQHLHIKMNFKEKIRRWFLRY